MTACDWWRGDRRRRLSRQSAGLTLVEVLITIALAAILMAVVANVLSSARAAAAAEERTSEPRRALDLAAELLSQELSLAGHAPWRLTTVPGAGPAVSVAAGSASHAVSVRFVDDRLVGPAVARDLTFEAAVDGRGVPQLYRRSGASARQPLVEGIVALTVEAVVTAEGDLRPPVPGEVHSTSRGLVLRLDMADGDARTAVVPLPSRPTIEVLP